MDNGADPNAEDIDGRTLTEWRENEAKKEAAEKEQNERKRNTGTYFVN